LRADLVFDGADNIRFPGSHHWREYSRGEDRWFAGRMDHPFGLRAGGRLRGLAGMVEVAAVQGRANESLAAGYGYAGILVAFVGRQNGLGVLLVSILLGGILASGGILQREHHLSDATVVVFQGIVSSPSFLVTHSTGGSRFSR